MAKVALLVDFYTCTRIVLDIPKGMTAEEYLENSDNYDSLVKKAREKMAQNLPDYLSGDNMEWDYDEACPAGSFDSD